MPTLTYVKPDGRRLAGDVAPGAIETRSEIEPRAPNPARPLALPKIRNWRMMSTFYGMNEMHLVPQEHDPTGLVGNVRLAKPNQRILGVTVDRESVRRE
jgi:hypothetical protein